MKKVYLGILSLAVLGSATAQVAKNYNMSPKNLATNEVSAKSNIDVAKAIPFWQNDFSVGADWTMTNNPGGVPPHTSGDWTITTDVNAIPVTALRPAGHTTAANGYAFINSDGAGSTATQNATIYTTGSIDCSTHPFVSIVFEQSTRHYAEQYFVVVSNDGGTTWTDFAVNTTMGTSVNSANPATTSVNISSVAANQANVKIGFKYYGAYDWYWAVDDVKLVETDNYDLGIIGMYWGSEGPWGARLPYYQVPLAQVTDVKFAGILENRGAQTQNDAQFNVAIASAGYASSSALGTLTPNQIDTMEATAVFTPGTASAATYNVVAGVTSGQVDANMADNTYTSVSIATNDNKYSRDKLTVASGSYNQGEAYEMGNIFDIYADAALQGAEVFVNSGSVVGSEIYATLYSIDPGTGDFVFVDQTPSYPIGNADLGAVMQLVFNSEIQLTAGSPYLLVAGSYGSGGANDDFIVGTAGISEAQTTYYFDGTDQTWYYSTSTPMVRMNFDPALSVNKNNLTANLSVYPNPANETATVSFDSKGETAVITVTDLAGKVVASMTATGKAEINTSNFAAGAYTVTVSANNQVATSKLIVRK